MFSARLGEIRHAAQTFNGKRASCHPAACAKTASATSSPQGKSAGSGWSEPRRIDPPERRGGEAASRPPARRIQVSKFTIPYEKAKIKARVAAYLSACYNSREE